MDQAEVSRRLKAARWLAGGVNAKGKPEALSVDELAAHPLLVQNRITKNRLQEFEQMVTTPRALELAVIGEALDLPEWFADGAEGASPQLVAGFLRRLASAADQVQSQAEEGSLSGQNGTDHPRKAEEGGGA